MNNRELLQKICSDQAKKIQELKLVETRLDLCIEETQNKIINSTSEDKKFVWKLILDALNIVKGEP